jgi:hypothetical protein
MLLKKLSAILDEEMSILLIPSKLEVWVFASFMPSFTKTKDKLKKTLIFRLLLRETMENKATAT